LHYYRRGRDRIAEVGRAYLNGFRGADPLLQGVSIVALVILTVITIPRVLPGTQSGVACGDLSSPVITGNNQSVLAQLVDPSTLHLELVADSATINQGQTLTLRVRFINESMAPQKLYLVPDDAVLRYTGQDVGLQISVTDATSGRALGEPPGVKPAPFEPTQYTLDQLHELGPQQRCTQTLVLTPQRLNAAGIVNGTYRFAAVYVNNTKGNLPPIAALTPTPIFKNQGVWVGTVQSNALIVTIGLPTQPPPR
jgi:hypothetical protein